MPSIEQLIAFQRGELSGPLGQAIAEAMQDPESEISQIMQHLVSGGGMPVQCLCGREHGRAILVPMQDPKMISAVKQHFSHVNN